jgi:ABC-type dipeptide/oligopeptide/nickel transport system permease subunit
MAFPGLAVVYAVLAFNLIAYGLTERTRGVR